ncbi:MAG: hypothetical protein NZ739_04130 [Verrucomicrobiae bacterium]|nr:hypothetical protein [Verrucomicrobiae bacterium]MCX7721692.1 hypothetical protein [Verrucomicrobiae bacterium]
MALFVGYQQLASHVLNSVSAMKKWAIVCTVTAVAGLGGVMFLKPGLAKGQLGQLGSAGNKTNPLQVVQQFVVKATTAVGSVALARGAERAPQQKNPAVKIITDSPGADLVTGAGNGTNAPAQHDPKIEAGLKAMNQLSVRGIIVSGSRSSAIIHTGGQTMPVFVGDTLGVKTPEGLVMLRCEKIDKRSVWIRIPQTPVLAELSLQ